MNSPLKVKLILGSTRDGRFGEQAAQWMLGELKGREDVAVEFLDLRDYPLPFFKEAMPPSMITQPYADPMVQQWTGKIADGDAFIMATPEYNHGPSGALKNAIDYVSKEWNKKPIGYVGWGTVGGARAIEELRLAAVELQMAPVRAAVYIVKPWMLPSENGLLKAGALDGNKDEAKAMIDQLVWWGNVLREARGKDA